VFYLFERIAAGHDDFSLEDAVAAQLARLVAVHDWELPPGLGTSLGLGLPSSVDIGQDGVGSLEGYAARLEQVIRRHEPRLENVKVLVRPSTDRTAPRLVVEAQLQAETGRKPFYFTLPGI
jgi:predicted component of type VI protein secretion system